MDNVVELQLESGWWVRCQPVPPLAIAGVHDKPEFWYPPPPTIEVSVQKGKTTETVPAPDGSPEQDEYYEKCREIDQARERLGQEFCYDYGILAWSEDQKKWQDEPDSKWELNERLASRLGVKPSGDRVAFIMYQLLGTPKDLRDVHQVIYSIDQRTLEDGEVQAAIDTFRD